MSGAESTEPLQLVIRQVPDGGYFVLRYGTYDPDGDPPAHRFSGLSTKRSQELTFGELLEMVAKVASRGDVKGPTYDENPHRLIKWGRVPEGYAALILPKEQMQFFSDRLSDLACWIAGFKAALEPDRYDRSPFGGEYVGEINAKIKAAIEKVKA